MHSRSERSKNSRLLLPTEKIETKRKANDFIGRVPDDVLAHMFTYLTTKEKGVIASVSKKWNKVSGSDAVWKEVCEKEGIITKNREANESFKSIFAKNDPSKSYYFTEIATDKPEGDLKQITSKNIRSGLFTNKQQAIDHVTNLTVLGARSTYVIYELKISDKTLRELNAELDTHIFGSSGKPAYYLADSSKSVPLRVSNVYVKGLQDDQFVSMKEEQPSAPTADVPHHTTEENKKPCIIS